MLQNRNSKYLLTGLILYLTFIIYGSLIPFELRPMTLQKALASFINIRYLQLGISSRADLLANFILYIPLSFLAAACWLRPGDKGKAQAVKFTLILLACVIIAVGIEFIQLFFAPRTVSLNDLIAEGTGSLMGLLLWQSVRHSRLAGLISVLIRPGPAALTAGLTLYALAYLVLALFPYDFVLSLSELQWKLAQGNYGWGFNNCGSIIRCSSQWLAEAIAALPLGLLLTRLQNRARPGIINGFLLSASLGLGIEAAQFLLASGNSTFSASLAKTIGIGLGIWLRNPPTPELARYHAHWLRPVLMLALIPYLGIVALLNNWGNAAWGDMEVMHNNLDTQHYLPFYYHYFTTETAAVASFITQMGIYLPMGIGFWLWHISGPTPLRRPPLMGLLLGTATIAFIIEAGKLFIAGSHPDPTNILIALGAAWLGQYLCQWLVKCARTGSTGHKENQPNAFALPRKALLGTGLVVLILGGIGLILIEQSEDSEAVMVAKIRHAYPGAESLPPVELPGFHLNHPRLPAPTSNDILRLKNENPAFLARNRRNARAGKGNLDAAVLMAYLEPGSQNLDTVYDRLIKLQFSGRGYAHGKTLVRAYDWLYRNWTETQRHGLQDKLIHGCNYLIEVIRNSRLSPYNATLYRGPAQTLMACSIALYRDAPAGDPVMAFTTDLWKNRILPVWRQVMGQHGGWHEGADKTSAGIGQAIYELPNMWRKATGEDYFRNEPGIRGFLDFLVYRERPDGQQLHYGDSSVFDRDAPDRLALALEYRHAAAYSLKPPPKKPRPTSWPWGPLTDNSLYDPEAVTRLPLSRHFDGIGLVVMRSDWDPDASYITFKAGDNYSSFTHLDQGSFTVFKGGALVIDSGLYDHYGSDHHLNYTYQTIAHNVATITNPDETGANITSKFNQAKRPIANDGGQRRIGGDIEIYPHPLDVKEWNAKYDIYHTGKIIRFTDQDDFVSITADITAAYTNRFSGEGSLSSRTLRVKRYLRTLIYDRGNDLLLIYDSIDKTNPEFTSRWLLHFQEQPVTTGPNHFLVSQKPASSDRPTGGVLEGEVLLPRHPILNTIGGPGREFWVNGHNYDNNGNIYKVLAGNKRKEAEAGSWRIEISPPNASETDLFLVALDLHRDWSSSPSMVQCSQGRSLATCVVHGARESKFQISAAGAVTIQ